MGDQDRPHVQASDELAAECDYMDLIAQQASFLRSRCREWGLPDTVADGITIDWAAVQWNPE